jgi:hypothetical protein
MSLVLPVKLIAECPRTDCNGLGDLKKNDFVILHPGKSRSGHCVGGCLGPKAALNGCGTQIINCPQEGLTRGP